MQYQIFALIGEAGSGKDFLMKHILADQPIVLNEIVSCTTRPPREGEIDGKHYHFIDNETFANYVYDKKMLEATTFNGWCYGTNYNCLSIKHPNIGVFNIAGIKQLLQNSEIDLTVFRIVCNDKTRLIRQLNREESPDVNEITRRFSTDKEDFKTINFNHIVIFNNDLTELKQALKDINKIIIHCSATQDRKD